MKIVITGRSYSDPDDRPVKLLRASGHEVVDYSPLNMGVGTDEETLARLIGDADVAVAGLEPYSAAVLEKCPNLKMISRRGIGYDSVDVDYCRRHGIVVARTLGAVEGAVAEHVLAYMLYFARRVDLQGVSMREGRWERMMQPGLKTRTLGLVGFGGIGKEIARRAVPFGMEVLYYARHPRPEWEAEYGVKYAPLEQLLAQSDYVSVNVPLTESTRGMFGEEQFARMKQGSVFINIARGPVADAAALRRALDSGHLRGAGVDVFDCEPCTDSPLVGCEKAVLTPHTASFTSENFSEMNRISAQNVLDFLEGKELGKNRVE